MNDRRGFTVIEVLVAIALFSLATLFVMPVFRTGLRGTARASEFQLAACVAATSVDRVIFLGHARLAELAVRGPADLDLEIASLTPAAAEDARVADIDGITFRGRVRIELVEPGLLRLLFRVEWNRGGCARWKAEDSLAIVRYTSDPGHCPR